jgi:hypothetical protein
VKLAVGPPGVGVGAAVGVGDGVGVGVGAAVGVGVDAGAGVATGRLVGVGVRAIAGGPDPPFASCLASSTIRNCNGATAWRVSSPKPDRVRLWTLTVITNSFGRLNATAAENQKSRPNIDTSPTMARMRQGRRRFTLPPA